MAWERDTITQNYCRLVQFNGQLLNTMLTKLDWVLSSEWNRWACSFMDPRVHTLQKKVMAKKQDEKCYTISTCFFFFPQEVDELHIQNIFNDTIHTKIVITTVKAPNMDLQHPGMGFSYTFSSCALQAIKQFSLLQSLPWLFIYATRVSFARLVEDRERKQRFLSMLLPKGKNTSWTLVSIWWNHPNLWAVDLSG